MMRALRNLRSREKTVELASNLAAAVDNINQYKDFEPQIPIEEISLFPEEDGFTIQLAMNDSQDQLLVWHSEEHGWVIQMEEGGERTYSENTDLSTDTKLSELDEHERMALALVYLSGMLIHGELGPGTEELTAHLRWTLNQIPMDEQTDYFEGLVTSTRESSTGDIVIRSEILGVEYRIDPEGLESGDCGPDRLLLGRIFAYE